MCLFVFKFVFVCVCLSVFVCVFKCVFVCVLTRDAVRARGVTRGGSRTRQLAQTEEQIAVVLMPLIPLFVRDG